LQGPNESLLVVARLRILIEAALVVYSYARNVGRVIWTQVLNQRPSRLLCLKAQVLRTKLTGGFEKPKASRADEAKTLASSVMTIVQPCPQS